MALYVTVVLYIIAFMCGVYAIICQWSVAFMSLEIKDIIRKISKEMNDYSNSKNIYDYSVPDDIDKQLLCRIKEIECRIKKCIRKALIFGVGGGLIFMIAGVMSL